MSLRKLDEEEIKDVKILIKEVAHLAKDNFEKEAYNYDWQQVVNALFEAKKGLSIIKNRA